nr:MAG TPA: hypothetical protein [Caudoviricetes sp.]
MTISAEAIKVVQFRFIRDGKARRYMTAHRLT